MSTSSAGGAQYFTPEQRQATLDRLLAAFETDDRIAGVIVVGSGSVGFGDAYSDIDLDVVMHAADDVAPVVADWTARIGEMFDVWGRFGVDYAPDSFLRGYLLENYLELDIGFVHLGNLAAGKWRWRVAFDRSGQIEDIQQRTWAAHQGPDVRAEYDKAVGSIWHYVLHVAVAARRGTIWRALHDLDTVRQMAIAMAGLRHELNVKRARYADELPAEFRAALERSLPGSATPEAVMGALRAATECFFSEARAVAQTLGVEPPDTLAERLFALLDAWG
jgi:predicted nucleotidyltransferase